MAGGNNVESIYRLSPTQEGILYHAIQAPSSGVYFQQFTCVLRGDIDAAAFERSWQLVLDRHPAMRALFTWEGRENPLQVVLKKVVMPFAVLDRPELLREGDDLEAFLADDRRRGFRLDEAPLQRVFLVSGQGAEHRLIWSFHHLLLDGWSMRLFFDQVLLSYAALRQGEAPPPHRSPSHESYIAWLRGQDPAAARDHWRAVLAGFDSPTELRLPPPRAVNETAEYGEHAALLSREETAALKAAARSQRVTLNTMLRGAWALLLGSYSGDNDVVFGATMSGRPAQLDGVESIVGLCINTLPVRAQLASDLRTGDWLRGLQEQQLDANEFETTPLVAVQRCSELPAGTPLFETILVFENLPGSDLPSNDQSGASSDLRVEAPRHIEASNYPLALLVIPDEELRLILVHDRSRYEPAAIARLADHLRTLLTGLAGQATNQGATLGELRYLTQPETEQLRGFSRGAGSHVSTGGAVLERLHEAAARSQGAPAIRCDGQTTTYGQLQQQVRALAATLRARGVRSDECVAVCLDRSPAMVVAILSVLEAGGAYVPLDPSWPADRIEHILGATNAVFVVTSHERAQTLPATSTPFVCVDDEHPELSTASAGSSSAAPTTDQRAYVLFTSGSTGTPKGVEITHGNLLHSTMARFEFYDAPVTSFLLLSPYHFDSSIAGLFWTLCSGGALVLPPPGAERDVRQLAELIRGEGVTHTLCLPSLYELLLEASEPGELASLRTVIVAGEACPRALATTHASRLPDAELVNEYGPTEATVWATASRLTDSAATSVPIGRPIGGTEAYVVDPLGRPVPVSIPGELLLGGPGIARGYVAEPQLTAERFVQRGILDDTRRRLYRTGDLVRFRESGELEFLGRVDRQVKIRGHRIELEEIETRLLDHAAVKEAAVIVRDGRLVAYVVSDPTAAALPRRDLRRDLAADLPDYMVPADVVTLGAMPRSATGKVDRRALPAPGPHAAKARRSIVPPQNPTEATIAAIWCDVLGVTEVSTTDNFFELGGDSLMSIRIIARAHQAKLRIDPARFAEQPTIAGMAAAAVAKAPAAGKAAARKASGPPPLLPIQRWFFDLELPEPHHWNQAVLLEAPIDAAPQRIEAAVRAVAAAHEALRLRFVKTDSGVRQEVTDNPPAALQRFDLSGLPETDKQRALEDHASRVQAGIDLASGQLLHAALLHWGPGAHPRLLLVVHHLAVDAVSWSVLRQDLERAFTQAERGEPIELTTNSASFSQWAHALAAVAELKATKAQASYWLDVANDTGADLPFDSDIEHGADRAGNVVETAEDVEVALDLERTQALLQEVPAAYNTRILDVLLTALAQAVQRWTGRRQLLFDLEGHGRDVPAADLDLSRTVGWLTAVWPVRLALPTNDEPGAALKSIKEQLRAIPDGGGSFGLLRYLHSDEQLRAEFTQLPTRDLLFNYLGREDHRASARFKTASEGVGMSRSNRGQRPYLIEINARVRDGVLTANWTFSTAMHRRATIEQLAADFIAQLAALIEHCRAPKAGGRTPSDFPLAGLDQAQLDKLSQLLGDDDEQ